MKLILPLIFSLISCVSWANNQLTIDIITTSDEDIQSITFFNLNQELLFQNIKYEDSVRITFENELADGYNLMFKANGYTKYNKQFWLEPGLIKIHVIIEKGKMAISEVNGSQIYFDQKEYIRQVLENKDWKLSEFNAYHKKQLLENIDNPFSGMIAGNFIVKNQNNKLELVWLYHIMESQKPIIKKHFVHNNTFNRLRALLKTTKIDLKNYDLINSDGYKTNIIIGEENIIVLDFWFVACPPCIKDHEFMKSDLIEEKFKNKNIKFIGISSDQNDNVWREYLGKKKILWDNYILSYDTNDKNLINDLSISSYPTYIIIDKNGEIKSSFNTYKEVRAHLENQ